MVMETIQLVVNMLIITAYLMIYFTLNTHYSLVLKRYRERMTIEEVREVQKNLTSFLILLIAICQIYAYRMIIFVKSYT